MTTVEHRAARPDHPSLDEPSRDVPVEISQQDLVQLIRTMRAQAHHAGRRVPGRPTLAKMIGVTPYRVRQALAEMEMGDRLARERDGQPAAEAHIPPHGVGTADSAGVVRTVPAGPSATEPPAAVSQPAGVASSPATSVHGEEGGQRTLPGASAAMPPARSRVRVRGDLKPPS